MKAPSLPCLRALRALAAPELHRSCLYLSNRTYATKPPAPTRSEPNLRSATGAATAALTYKPPPRGSDDDPTPKPLMRPIGMTYPPAPGQNTGVDSRSWRQRRNDFVDYEKHLERREKMAKQISKPYFRDFSAMRHFKGKTFVAPERVFKRESALWFPNLQGMTLAKGKERTGRDTTDVLRGQVSVVSVFSSGWAEHQVATFCSEKEHPALQAVLKAEKEVAQHVEINVEPNALKWWILRLFAYRIRAQKAKEDWGKYFMVRRGIDEEIKEAIGLLNSRVGYVYLVDSQCRIRWAGSARADDREKDSMVKCLRRLITETRQGKGAGIGTVEEKRPKAAETEVVERL